jgi:hypothetical protein
MVPRIGSKSSRELAKKQIHRNKSYYILCKTMAKLLISYGSDVCAMPEFVVPVLRTMSDV